MAANSKTEWTDHTFNPWIGCTKVSPGCDHCYAEARMDKRLHIVNWGPGQPRKRTSAVNWAGPGNWNAKHDAFFAEHGRRQRMVRASLADVFDNEVPVSWRADLLALINETPNLDWLLLTKRIGNVERLLREALVELGNGTDALVGAGLPPNVRIGISITSQPEADRDVTKLLDLGLPNFLSMEPLLGPVDIRAHMWPVHGSWPMKYKSLAEAIADGAQVTYRRQGLVGAWVKFVDWVIVGGESGPNARPMDVSWAQSLQQQCAAAGVPFFMKQMGGTRDKRGALEDLPEDLRIREFP